MDVKVVIEVVVGDGCESGDRGCGWCGSVGGLWCENGCGSWLCRN